MERSKLIRFFIFSILLIFQMSADASNLLMGTIKFPEAIEHVPLVPLWAGGYLLKREIDQKTKELSYQIPRYHNQRQFYLIVTEGVYPIKSDTNTNNVSYLQVPENQPYKLYFMEIRQNDSKSGATWFIEEHLLQPERRIPDNAIIFFYRPEAVTTVEGGTAYSLPTVKITERIVDLFGSQELMAEDAVRCAIASISVNTFHSMFPQSIKVDKGRTLVACVT